jgi:hypothetical protein
MEPCNQNVFKNGHSIATLDACMHRAETFVQAVAKESGQPVDWHYSGGIANVLYLGDFDKVKVAFDKLTPMLSEPMKREKGECGSCGCFEPTFLSRSDRRRFARMNGRRKAVCIPKEAHDPAHVFRRYEAAAHGPYRAGDEVVPGTIAVVTTI